MRVLMVNKYHRFVGGTERYIGELTRLLEQKGHQVVPFAMDDARNDPSPYAEYFVSAMEFFDTAHRPAPWTVAERVIYSREARRKIEQLIKATQPDIAHLHNIAHYISPSILDALHKHQIPAVMTLHDYKLICPAYNLWIRGHICERCRNGRFYQCTLHQCNHDSLPASLLNSLEGYIHRITHIYDKVAAFISPSQFLRQKHVEHGLDPSRILAVPNFVNVKDYFPRFDHDGYFAYVGRITPFKGGGTLLKAMKQLQTSPPLLIIGDGPAKADLETQAKRLALENVRFIGHQSGEALFDLVRGAMFIVVPSEWYENCPYAVLEAFALGKPVLGANIGGIPELVKPGVNGLLFEPGQAASLAEQLTKLLAFVDIKQLGQAARKGAEELYSEKAHYDSLAALYSQL